MKEAYQIAQKEIADIYPMDKSDFRLEQAEYKEEKNLWEIVVSYLVEKTNKPIGPFPALAELKYDRIYKTFKIKDSGEVAGFYIYNN